jgi:DNA modification methylase
MSKEIAAVWEDIDRLVPWDQNPRHNKSAIQSVADSIKRFGFGAPIVAREQDKMVIAGHTRLAAAKLLNLDRVPVRYLDLDPADAKMLALADNKIGEIADWNEEMLASIIDELSLSVDDMQDIGWSKEEIDGLFDPVFDSIEEPKPKESVIDIENLSAEVLHGDCMQRLKEIPTASIDAIVTDPPYGLSPDGKCRTWADIEEGRKLSGFMGKEWDAAVPCHNFFAECLRVLKPGGHLIAFSSTRTVFALGMACQKGGFELRDQIFWCYFSGFPKSHDISKAIDREAGAVREVVGYDEDFMRRNPNNTGVGAGDICGNKEKYTKSTTAGAITKPATKEAERWSGFGTALKPAIEPALLARKPLEKGLTIAQNILKHGTGALNIDGCRFGYGDPCWVGDSTAPPSVPQPIFKDQPARTYGYGSGFGRAGEYSRPNDLGRWPANLYQCSKPSTKEREQGLDHLQSKSAPNNLSGGTDSRLDGNPVPMRANFHPTVKPLKLMRWCCRLIGGQKGSVILDPFGGSGTTGAAAILEGFDCILIEREADYLPIIDARLKWAKNNQGDADG